MRRCRLHAPTESHVKPKAGKHRPPATWCAGTEAGTLLADGAQPERLSDKRQAPYSWVTGARAWTLTLTLARPVVCCNQPHLAQVSSVCCLLLHCDPHAGDDEGVTM